MVFYQEAMDTFKIKCHKEVKNNTVSQSLRNLIPKAHYGEQRKFVGIN